MTCKVEGREYTASSKSATTAPASKGPTSISGANSINSRSQTPSGAAGGRTSSPSISGSGSAESRKAKVDDKYFARLGADNASRPDDLPPSQGGKYAGFGSSGPEPVRDEAKLPGFEDLQKDPVAALTRGFGWFTTTVGKTAKSVNEGYIQPTAQKVRSCPFRPNHLITPHRFSSA